MIKKTTLFLPFILFVGSLIGQNLYSGKIPDSLRWEIEEFTTPKKSFHNPNSEFYHDEIYDLLLKMDTSLSAEQIVSYNRFSSTKKEAQGKLLDELGNQAYEQNEKELYLKAIETCKKLKKIFPGSIAAHKELSYAYAQLGDTITSQLHFTFMKKLISGVFKFSNGDYDHPFIVGNSFDEFCIYESVFSSKPSKSGFILTKDGRMLGAFYGYSPTMNEILILYCEAPQYKGKLESWEYAKEE